MKLITLFLMLTLHTGIAQIKGDKDLQTRTYDATNLKKLEIGLYANIHIDLAAPAGIAITTDKNLFEFIDTEIVDERLNLTQLKWIRPSEQIIIRIGAPNLEWIQNGTHNEVIVTNLKSTHFVASALNGKIVLKGAVDVLNVNAENGFVDAKDVVTERVNLNIWGLGKAIIAPKKALLAQGNKDATIELLTKPESIKGNLTSVLNNKTPSSKVFYINFKIKNNSKNRHNFFVIGPKPNGRKFSYGFPMMPGSIRKENWTTGTKIYKVSTLGTRKLVKEIKKEDEGQTVNLF